MLGLVTINKPQVPITLRHGLWWRLGEIVPWSPRACAQLPSVWLATPGMLRSCLYTRCGALGRAELVALT